MKYLIGLPVYKREWILSEWFECIENQTVPLSDMGFLFLMSNQYEDPYTYEIIFDWQAKHPEVQYFNIIEETSQRHKVHVPGTRAWKLHDYKKLAAFRNTLLEHVKIIQPEYYFSLDSDILLSDPNTLETLTKELVNFNAVSPLAYMSPASTKHPNVLSWKRVPGQETVRKENYPIGTVFKSDIIMAAVLMDQKAYNKADYKFHIAGEDVGWAYSMWKNGLTMGSVSNIYTPHIMHITAPVNRAEAYREAPGLYPVYKQLGDNRGETSLLNNKTLQGD